MSHNSLPFGATNLVYLGGVMAFVKSGMDAEELKLNFVGQIEEFCIAYEEEGGDPDELTFVIGFNSQASVDALNAMGENVTLAATDEERITFFEGFCDDIGADAILSFDDPKLGDLFQRFADTGQPFIGIVKRGGYGPKGSDQPLVCEGMTWVAENGGLPLSLPDWQLKSGETITPATAKSHSS